MSDFTHYRVLPDQQIPVRTGVRAHGNDRELPPDRMEQDQDDPTGVSPIENLKMEIISLDAEEMVFDMSGVDASIANALRRILLSEVPTVAVENVYISVNSSIIQDEVLAHRIGLIPIKVDPRKLDFVSGEEETDKDTLVFHYDVECKNQYSGELKPNGEKEYVNELALSGALKWLPHGNQLEVFPEGEMPVSVHSDIVVAKLKPGQRIEFEAHLRKGVGKDHQKFSPVATASYRLLPEITYTKPITGKRAEALVKVCPLGVFDIEDIGGTATAVTARPRDCTMCRECLRVEEWPEVEVKKVADHFIFSIESSGCLPPEVIFREAVGILKDKALKFRNLVDDYENQL